MASESASKVAIPTSQISSVDHNGQLIGAYIKGNDIAAFMCDKLRPSSYLSKEMYQICAKTQHGVLIKLNVHLELVQSVSPVLAKRLISVKDDIDVESDDGESTDGASSDGSVKQVGKGARDRAKDAGTGGIIVDDASKHDDTAVLGVHAVMLDEFLAEELAMVVDWMYGYNISWSTLRSSSPFRRITRDMPLMPLMSLYFCVAALKVRRLQNQIMDAIRWWITRRGPHASLRVLSFVSGVSIDKTPLHTFALRHFVHDLMELNARDSDWLKDCDKLKDDTIVLIGREMIRYQLQPYTDPALLKGFHFHVHEDDSSKRDLIREPMNLSAEQDEWFVTD